MNILIKKNFNKSFKSHNIKCIDDDNSAVHYKSYSYLGYNILKLSQCNWIKEMQNFKYFILIIFKHI